MSFIYYLFIFQTGSLIVQVSLELAEDDFELIIILSLNSKC